MMTKYLNLENNYQMLIRIVKYVTMTLEIQVIIFMSEKKINKKVHSIIIKINTAISNIITE